MIITKEDLLTRLGALEGQHEELVANVNATAGAISDCRFWLEVLEHEEPKKESKKK